MQISLQMMSVNQIPAQIQLTEIWKVVNGSQYSLRVEQKIEVEDGIATRSISRGDRIEFSCNTSSKKSRFCFFAIVDINIDNILVIQELRRQNVDVWILLTLMFLSSMPFSNFNVNIVGVHTLPHNFHKNGSI